MSFIDWIISMIPEQYKPFVAFAVASAIAWHFYGNTVKEIAKAISYKLNNTKLAE